MGTPPDRPADEELLSRWRGGDPRAGASLFERHYESVVRFFANKIGLDCGDLVQATFLGCLEGIERFRGEASFRTLLFAIARNKLLYHLRTRASEGRRLVEAEVSICDLRPSMTSVIAARREQRLLLEALRRLDLETQLILELHYWEQLKVREIAEILDIPGGTVKTRMYQGRRRLAGILAEIAESDELLESTIDGLDRWARQLRGILGTAGDGG